MNGLSASTLIITLLIGNLLKVFYIGNKQIEIIQQGLMALTQFER